MVRHVNCYEVVCSICGFTSIPMLTKRGAEVSAEESGWKLDRITPMGDDAPVETYPRDVSRSTCPACVKRIAIQRGMERMAQNDR